MTRGNASTNGTTIPTNRIYLETSVITTSKEQKKRFNHIDRRGASSQDKRVSENGQGRNAIASPNVRGEPKDKMRMICQALPLTPSLTMDRQRLKLYRLLERSYMRVRWRWKLQWRILRENKSNYPKYYSKIVRPLLVLEERVSLFDTSNCKVYSTVGASTVEMMPVKCLFGTGAGTDTVNRSSARPTQKSRNECHRFIKVKNFNQQSIKLDRVILLQLGIGDLYIRLLSGVQDNITVDKLLCTSFIDQ